LRVAIAAAAAGDDLRYDLEPAAVATAGRRMLAAMVESLPVQARAAGRDRRYPLAAQLWPRLGPGRATPGLVHVLNAAMVLLADHELAASTLAARVAASVRADPYSVVSTGLGVMAGSLHGAASHLVVDLFEDVRVPGAASRVVGERLRTGARLPGLGHQVYRRSDPRAALLLELLARLPLPRPRWSVVEAVREIVGARLPVVLNVDFAIGALAYATGMDRNAGEVIFSVARTAGWLAHAVEEYAEAPLRFRPRAAYTGPRP
jgi:citrate synthase